MLDKSKTYWFYTLIVAPEIHADLLWDLTILFVVLCALYFGVIFFFRRKLSINSKTVRNRKRELSPMISEFLFYDQDAPKEEKTNYVNLKIEIRELLNHPFNRKVLINVLMDLRKDLSGATLYRLCELYQSLGLHHDSYKKLESWRWQAISTGITELTQMRVEESYVFVTKFINDKRSTIRKQAEIAIITLKNEGLDFFLDTTTFRISEWQQLKIIEVLKNKKSYQPPSFKQWLTSKNNDVVLFALRLMKYYNQSDGLQALTELLKHKNGAIKVASIECIKEFNVVEAIDTLKLVFWNSSVDIKISILDAIGYLGVDNDIEFLRQVEAKESNFNVRSKVLSSINAIAPMTVMPTKDILTTAAFKVPKDLEIVNQNEFSKEQSFQTEIETKSAFQSNKKIQAPGIESNSKIEESAKESKNESLLSDVNPLLNQSQSRNEKVQVDDLKNEIDTKVEREKIENNYEFKVDFIPLVKAKEVEEQVEKYHPEQKYTNLDQNINELQVVFEIVPMPSIDVPNDYISPVPTQHQNDSDLFLKSTLLDFLPIVTETEHHIEEFITQDHKALDLLKMEVVYTEIIIDQSKENKILKKLNELIPLPILPKVNFKEKNNVKQQLTVPTSTKDIDMKILKKIEYEGVEIKIENQKQDKKVKSSEDSKSLEEQPTFVEPKEQSILDWILDLNESHAELKQKIKAILIDQKDIDFKLPKPIIYDNGQLQTMTLLDDIEMLGDQREVPLLESLLLDEKESVFHERIQFLIEKILDTSLLRKELSPQKYELFSVFEEFYNKADYPSKLILLNQVVAVGDQKEIPFLKRLVVGSDKKIAKAANICLERLAGRLLKEKGIQVDETKTLDEILEVIMQNSEAQVEKPFNVFDIDFDVTFENPEENETKFN